MAVKQWRHYIELGTFTIRSDHESLKYLLDQQITNQIQKKGLSKLMGLSYQVLYRKGRENKVADALSKRWEETELSRIAPITPTWIEEAKQSYEGDQETQLLI